MKIVAYTDNVRNYPSYEEQEKHLNEIDRTAHRQMLNDMNTAAPEETTQRKRCKAIKKKSLDYFARIPVILVNPNPDTI